MVEPRMAMLMAFVLLGGMGASAAEIKPGEIIVKYRDELVRSRSGMNQFYDSIGVEAVSHFSENMPGLEHLVLGEKADIHKVIEKLNKNYIVEYAQPNYILRALPMVVSDEDGPDDSSNSEGIPCWVPGVQFPPGCGDTMKKGSKIKNTARRRPELRDAPADVDPPVNDPNASRSYGLAKIGATRIWPTFSGSKEFIVADIDTGIDYNHEDLASNLWRNPKPGTKNDIVGFDFVHNDGLPYDDNEHGTHTAGTIGATGGNGLGTSGVIQHVSLMALKFLDADGSGTTADAIRAIDYAINHGAKVLSNSWGGKGDSDNRALQDAIDRAAKRDVLFVAAAGNDGTNNDGSDPSYPAAYNNDNLIAVAATDQRDRLAYFSNYGKKTTHVAAPGVAVYSTEPGDKYGKLSGTSMACPHVAGAAALLWARHPDWNYKQVKDVLIETVDHVPSLKDKTVSGGRINIEKAIAANE